MLKNIALFFNPETNLPLTLIQYDRSGKCSYVSFFGTMTFFVRSVRGLTESVYLEFRDSSVAAANVQSYFCSVDNSFLGYQLSAWAMANSVDWAQIVKLHSASIHSHYRLSLETTSLFQSCVRVCCVQVCFGVYESVRGVGLCLRRRGMRRECQCER